MNPLKLLKTRIQRNPSLLKYGRLIKSATIQCLTDRKKTNSAHILSTYAAGLNKDFKIRLYEDPVDLKISKIEINKNCNLNCEMCHTELSTRKNGTMEISMFERLLIKAVQLGQTQVLLSTIGEPLINPKIEDYFKILRKHRMYAFISTNALPLKKKYP